MTVEIPWSAVSALWGIGGALIGLAFAALWWLSHMEFRVREHDKAISIFKELTGKTSEIQAQLSNLDGKVSMLVEMMPRGRGND